LESNIYPGIHKEMFEKWKKKNKETHNPDLTKLGISVCTCINTL